jgi:prophage regulatory protein
MTRLLRIKTVSSLVGLSHSEIYRLMSLDKFPRPIPLGARAVAWTESSVDEWIQSRVELAGSRN